MKKISLVIPVYNVEKYLPQCLDSVINQTWKNLEIICVNDGSPDNSAAILEQYAAQDPRFKIIDRPNGGLSAARNTGLEHATGDYIFFLDSDDYINPECLKELADNIGDENLIYSQIRNFSTKKSKIISRNFDSPRAFSRTCFVWGCLYKKEILKGLRFPEGMYYEDKLFSFSVFSKIGFKKYPVNEKACYFYRGDNPNSITNNPKHIKDTILIAEQMVQACRHNPELLDACLFMLTQSIRGIIKAYEYPFALKKDIFNNCFIPLANSLNPSKEMFADNKSWNEFQKYCRYNNVKIGFIHFLKLFKRLQRRIFS